MCAVTMLCTTVKIKQGPYSSPVWFTKCHVHFMLCFFSLYYACMQHIPEILQLHTHGVSGCPNQVWYWHFDFCSEQEKQLYII